jgi:beta-lactamase regulating signal transducer with metallopeptidase domain
MNTLLSADVANAWVIAGWTMIHFLWLGTLVAVAAFVGRWILRRASPTVRYTVALSCLMVLVALPIAIAAWLGIDSPPLKGGAGRGTDQIAHIPIADVPTQLPSAPHPGEIVELHSGADAPTPPAIAAATPKQAAQAEVGADATKPSPDSFLSGRGSSFLDVIETCIPYLPWLWLIGTPITFALTATGLIGTRRLRRACRPITAGPIVDALQGLIDSLRITRRVVVAVCDRIASPVLIGILRPIILLPPAALTGYSPDEIEMVLLHELAHVRRWDNLVNLVQRFVESLLFFHPAVWLVSAWVRREREACCDALVVTRTDRPHAYAELLVALAAQMPRSVLFHPAATSAMSAGPLRSRIRRILKLDDDPMLVSGKSMAILLASLLAMATLIGLSLPAGGRAEASDTESTEKAEAASVADKFPHQVPFEKGASKVLDGDAITIDEIRGTANTFEPGNRYWIKGTYRLKSHD